MAQQKDLLSVDWTQIPAPIDDGEAMHLAGSMAPAIALSATSGTSIDLSRVPGRVVVFAYPRTGQPGQIGLVDEWDMIPGARGCTPQTCSFRDLNQDFASLNTKVFGLSTQDTAYQSEMVERMHVPFPILSDSRLDLTKAWRLPTMDVAGQILLKRLELVLDNGRVEKVFYPVFPPDRNAADVLAYLNRPPL